MQTKNKYVKIRVVPLEAAQERTDIDPAELWLDQDIEPEALIELDPLDIEADMVDQAEQPELGDPLLTSLPNRASSVWGEQRWLRQLKKRPGDHESRRRFVEAVMGSK